MWLGLGVSLAILALVVVAAIWLTREQHQAAQEVEQHAAISDALNNAARQGAAGAAVMQFYVLTGDESHLPAFEALVEEARAYLDQAVALYREHGHEEEAATVEALLDQAGPVGGTWREVIALIQAGEQEAAIALMQGNIAATQALGEAIFTQTNEEQARIQAARSRSELISDLTLYTLLVIGGVGATASLLAGIGLSRSILRPLSSLRRVASRVSSGDLDARSETSGPAEIRDLSLAFNEMTEALLDASRRRELEAQREVLVRDLGERVKELTALQRVSRLVQGNPDIDEVIAGIAAILPPAMQYPESAGARVTVDGTHEAEINFAETPWVLRTSNSTEAGQRATISVCYHEGFPEYGVGPFLPEEDTMLATVTDILRTYLDQRDAAEAARNSIERFSTAFHASPVPISIVRMRDARVIDVNDAFLEILGWTREEAIGGSIHALGIWPSDEDRETFVSDLVDDEEVNYGEMSLRNKSGDTLNVIGSAEMIELDGEDCVLSIFYDITDRKKAEAALYDAEERWNSLINHSSDLVSLLDMTGVIIDESPAVKPMLGYEQGELIGKNAFDLVHAEDAPALAARFQGFLMDPDEAATVEFRYRHKDGTYRQLQAVGSALRDSSGELEGVIVVSRDVTDQRRMEERMAFQARLLDTVGQAAIATGTEGKVIYCNQAAAELYGWTCDEMLGMRINEVTVAEQSTEQANEIMAMLAKGETWQGEFTVRRRDGTSFPAYVTDTPIMDEEGNFIGVIGVSTDISERLERQREMTFQAHLLEASGEAAIATDTHGYITYWNPAAEAMYGWTRDEVMGKPVFEIISDIDSTDNDFEMIVEAVRHRPISGEWNVYKKDGTVIPIESTMSVLRAESGEMTGVIGVSRNVTERKRSEETIRHMAYHDPLTGLPNRLLLNDRFEVALAASRRTGEQVCVLSADLDRFKVVNDTLGHAKGDELLKAAAERLKNHARDGDTVARVGGDEFVILLTGCKDGDGAMEAAHRLVEAFRYPFIIDEAEFHSTLSVGISTYPEDGDDAESLLGHADAAMYAAKETGRDRYRTFGPDIDTRPAGWLALEADLRRALAGDEIRVYYQPQVNVTTGEVVGVEALARWRHPVRGLMSPNQFIQLAEESGLIVALGEQVLTRACTQAMSWTGPNAEHVTLAVNVSLRQLERPDFVDMVERVLSETRFPPQRLELELTESSALTNIALTRSVADKLADMGIRLALDDFGTGNTALRYLSELPVNTLKIDRSFVQNMVHDHKNAEIAASVIALGHALSLNVIAEGVETQEQLDALRLHKCHQYQGYLHSKPMKGIEIARMLVSLTPEAVG